MAGMILLEVKVGVGLVWFELVLFSSYLQCMFARRFVQDPLLCFFFLEDSLRLSLLLIQKHNTEETSCLLEESDWMMLKENSKMPKFA